MKALALVGTGLIALTLVSACGDSKKSTPSSSTLTAGAQAVKRLQTEVDELGSMLADNGSGLTPNGGVATLGAISNWSTTAVMPDPRNDGSCHPTAVTLKEWMGYEFDEDAVRCNDSAINVFGRVKNVVGIGCIIFNTFSASSSTDLPSSGTSSIVFDSAKRAQMLSDCEMALPNSDFTVGITFDTPSSTTLFDRKLTFALPADLGGATQVFYVRYNSSNAAIGTSEDNSNGSQRTIATFDFGTRILKGEYISRSSGGANVYVHRLYKDEANDIARVHSMITNASGTDEIRYVVSGKPNSNDDLSLSIKVTGYGFGSPMTGEACVVPSTGNISSTPTVSSGSFTCGTVTGKTEASATGSATVKTTIDGASTTWWNISSAAPSLSWSTIDDMLTAGL